MKRVTSAELIRNFGQFSDVAVAEPVIITKNGRDRLALISIDQYNAFQHAADASEDMRAAGREARVKPPRQNVSARRRR